MFGLLSFNDLSRFDAGRANVGPFDDAVQLDLHALKVRIEAAQHFTNDLGTSTAGTLDLSASFIFIAGYGTLIADNTCSHECHLCLKY